MLKVRRERDVITRSVVLIDNIRPDGLVFAGDYTDCDHSYDGFRKVMFRTTSSLKKGSVYSIDMEDMEKQKPFVSYSNSKKTRYETPQYFYHKVSNVRFQTSTPTLDDLLDL